MRVAIFPSAFTSARRAARAFPAIAALIAFALLVRGHYVGLAEADWTEVGGLVCLVVGVCIASYRWLRKSNTGGILLRDELELGGCLLAAAFVAVTIGGTAFFPLVYLVVAFLVSF